MVRRKDALDVDHGALCVTLLDCRGERAADGVRWEVIVVITHLAAPCFGAAYVQAMDTVLRSRIARRSASSASGSSATFFVSAIMGI